MSTIRTNAILDAAGGNTATINGKTPIGTSDIASAAQAAAGTDNTTVITPLRVRDAMNASGSAPIYACRAWVLFDGTGTVSITASGNVTSVTDNGTGAYTINFATAMPDANYATLITSGTGPNTNYYVGHVSSAATPTASSVRIQTMTQNSGNPQATDHGRVSVAIFR